MSFWDFLDKHWHSIFILMLLALSIPILRVGGDPARELVLGMLKEVREISEKSWNRGGVNALGIIAMLALLVVLNVVAPLDFLAGESKMGEAAENEWLEPHLLFSVFSILMLFATFKTSYALNKG